MDYKVKSEKIVLDKFLKVFEAEVEHDTYRNEGKIQATRLALDRGDSVAILIYERDTDQFLFTEQFRYPSSRRNVPFILELPAGAIDDGETAQDAAQREVLEEIGYKIDNLEKISTYFPSPGMSSEVIHLFFAQVETGDKVNNGGGAASEKEDIKLVPLSRKRALEKLPQGFFNNSITIIGLQWFLLNKENLI
ncbi:ADP-ribose pyrophosphatase [Nonlabens spongiae]|uniref:ADP-ribose pyrophosphatase n=1 Tax=Nonlabens spongiae TaxID=331648 RepID=A0A1W6MNX5_9FLAO|nr:NUDIX hydrolase [Nonlabens spongiae]ARN79169.1 ADP-ribose pyrophosphatase [Nonlabens spongiae]